MRRLYRWPVGCHWHYCLRRLQDANSVLPRLAIPRHHCCISAPTTAALPPWSPDGNEIVYVCTLPSKPAQVCIVSRDGGAIEQVQLPSSSFPDDPQWSPDGKSLLIALYPAGASAKPRISQWRNTTCKRKKSLPWPAVKGCLVLAGLLMDAMSLYFPPTRNGRCFSKRARGKNPNWPLATCWHIPTGGPVASMRTSRTWAPMVLRSTAYLLPPVRRSASSY
ncbi:MAG: hypothetical protein DMG97_32550 [Acidobacteria bacterium]|nr:MAG: hypothetical protein DMG97_32550 [Acidobacteriota bacterium]PYV75111.1 MAG: hypothetical protein DMG96_18280 [Acidobacteriota bacterium]